MLSAMALAAALLAAPPAADVAAVKPELTKATIDRAPARTWLRDVAAVQGKGGEFAPGGPAWRRVYGGPFDDASLAKVAALPRLEALVVQGTAVTDAGLTALVGAKSLCSLDLKGPKVTAAGLAKFRQARPDVTLAP
jgi:hypothetical protein